MCGGFSSRLYEHPANWKNANVTAIIFLNFIVVFLKLHNNDFGISDPSIKARSVIPEHIHAAAGLIADLPIQDPAPSMMST